MKCIMVAAVSKDGFLTRGDDPNPSHWTSEEDKAHLKKMLSEHSLHILGSKTYEAYKPKANKSALKIVLTHSPEKYAVDEIPDMLEFKTLTPEEFKNKYDTNYESCLLLGGGSVYRQFLDAGIVDEIYLTIEPVTNQSGVSFLRDGETLEDLHLPDPTIQIQNNIGTELRHYILKK